MREERADSDGRGCARADRTPTLADLADSPRLGLLRRLSRLAFGLLGVRGAFVGVLEHDFGLAMRIIAASRDFLRQQLRALAGTRLVRVSNHGLDRTSARLSSSTQTPDLALLCEAGAMDSARARTARAPRNLRPRDALGRPLPYGSTGVARQPEGIDRTPAEALREAHVLLAAGLPFHAHEVLEDAWKAGPDAERELWRGLAQLAVGATHAARGNRPGAVALLRRGRAALAAVAGDAPHGLDIDAIMRWCDASVARVAAQCPLVLPGPPLLPR